MATEKLYFKNDYSEGACEQILRRFMEINYQQNTGYGTDEYCKSAEEKIRLACNCKDAQVKFICGGTQTNQLVISTMLQPFEGVIGTTTAHVAAHEAGAIEYSGHKVLTLPHHDGKIDPVELVDLIETFWNDDSHEHMVYPGMVYVSHPTELGTLYSKAELQAVANVCKNYNIPLYLDGARLGYGLMSEESDLTLEDIAELCDVFYIGGTKVGCLCGEAVVFTRNNMPKCFVAQIKQHGALMAKGWVTGLQFDTLFTDGLYYELGRHAIEMANLLKQGFVEKGYKLSVDSPTNQQFIVVDNEQHKKLSEIAVFENWERLDKEHTVVRFVTSWATKKETVEKLISLI
ncbi:MAG: aminotransferase class I/II-fold pyridoxal phosphate-dependent enzyme [Ruminococcaceae bacterium]|nr:aminotransferase class I/II-fold pyridoxal phosphate-dependent enzyme [Oscillospiraceae bacterium]